MCTLRNNGTFSVRLPMQVETVSIWLAVLLSVFRYACVRPRATTTLVVGGAGAGDLGRVRCAIVAVYAFAAVILVPNYLSYVARRSPTNNQTGNAR